MFIERIKRAKISGKNYSELLELKIHETEIHLFSGLAMRETTNKDTLKLIFHT